MINLKTLKELVENVLKTIIFFENNEGIESPNEFQDIIRLIKSLMELIVKWW